MAPKKTTKGRTTKTKKSTGASGPKKPSPRAQAEESARAAAIAVAEAGLEKKALQVEIIDVRGKVDYADYVVVMSGRSDRQVNAIARGVEEHLKKKLALSAIGVEGLPQGTWVLMDFGDVIVHVFHEDTRGYYDVESLWIDAARVDAPELATG